jgi:hypothetical protein
MNLTFGPGQTKDGSGHEQPRQEDQVMSECGECGNERKKVLENRIELQSQLDTDKSLQPIQKMHPFSDFSFSLFLSIRRFSVFVFFSLCNSKNHVKEGQERFV